MKLTFHLSNVNLEPICLCSTDLCVSVFSKIFFLPNSWRRLNQVLNSGWSCLRPWAVSLILFSDWIVLCSPSFKEIILNLDMYFVWIQDYPWFQSKIENQASLSGKNHNSKCLVCEISSFTPYQRTTGFLVCSNLFLPA